MPSNIQIAIIGAGPSGLFTAQEIIKTIPNAHVHLLEKLPIPYGLLRYGVAPDHQKLKETYRFFQTFLNSSKRIHMYCNIHVGTDVSIKELEHYFDSLVFCYGAEKGRTLTIPGHELNRIYSSETVVGWYNSHPDYQTHHPFNESKNIGIIGLGNVALDIARLLNRSYSDLAKTDISINALKNIQELAIQNVYIIGRKGPCHTSFTFSMVKELLDMDTVNHVIDPNDLKISTTELTLLSTNQKRILDLFKSVSQKKNDPNKPNIIFKFFHLPERFIGTSSLEAIECTVMENKVKDQEWIWRKTSTKQTLSIDTIITCIGYKGQAMENLPFDKDLGTIPNKEGRIIQKNKSQTAYYASGWIKRGANGVIGTNKQCAKQTVKHIRKDMESTTKFKNYSNKHIRDFLCDKQKDIFSMKELMKIDEMELKKGKSNDKIRLNILSLKQAKEWLNF